MLGESSLHKSKVVSYSPNFINWSVMVVLKESCLICCHNVLNDFVVSIQYVHNVVLMSLLGRTIKRLAQHAKHITENTKQRNQPKLNQKFRYNYLKHVTEIAIYPLIFSFLSDFTTVIWQKSKLLKRFPNYELKFQLTRSKKT